MADPPRPPLDYRTPRGAAPAGRSRLADCVVTAAAVALAGVPLAFFLLWLYSITRPR